MKNTPRKHTYIISSITIVCQKQPRWVQITRRFLRRSTVDAIINLFRLTLLHCACDFYSTPKSIPVLPSSTTYCYVLHISRPRFESIHGRKAKKTCRYRLGGGGADTRLLQSREVDTNSIQIPKLHDPWPIQTSMLFLLFPFLRSTTPARPWSCCL